MLKIILPTLFVFYLFCPQSMAADDQQVRIVISKTDCSRLLRHTPRDDVTYRPGEDSKGRKVAPADLPGSGASAMPDLLPGTLEIPLTVKPLSGMGYATHGMADSTMPIGTVKYDMAKNTFTFNDKPLGSQDQRDLAEACRRQGMGR